MAHRLPVALLADPLVTSRQGDVNATHVNPFRMAAPAGVPPEGALPIYRGVHAKPFAPLAAATEWVRPGNRPGLNAAQRSACAALERIAGLTKPEYGFVLQQITNTHIRDRLRGTWFRRSAEVPVVFANNVYRFLARPGEPEGAEALFGLVTSRLLCYLYGLFGTNTHMLRGLLYRMPTPDAATFPRADLARHVGEALTARAAMRDGEVRLGVRGRPPRVAADRVGSVSGVSTITVRDALDRDLLRPPARGGARRLVMVLRDRAAFADPEGSFAAAVTRLAADSSDRRDDFEAQRVPDPAHAARWLEAVARLDAEAAAAAGAYEAARAAINAAVNRWYDLTDAEAALVDAGLPWDSGNWSGAEEVDDDGGA